MFSTTTISSLGLQPLHLTTTRNPHLTRVLVLVLVVKTTTTSKPIHFRHGFCRALHLEQNPPSNSQIDSESSSFTADYLIDSFGLDPDLAHSLPSKFQLPSTEIPDSVLALFRAYGFTQAQIARIVSSHPDVLVMDPETSLKPKLDFFRSSFLVSGTELADVIATYPVILVRSLENDVLPAFHILKNYVVSNAVIFKAYKRYTSVLRYSSVMLMEYNIKVLLEMGVPKDDISSIIKSFSKILVMRRDMFKKAVGTLREMGFDPRNRMFVHALRSRRGLSKKSWDKKVLLFRSFGWSEQEMHALFWKQPIVMSYSVEKLREGLKYFLEERKLTRETIIKSPWLLGLSMKKRIIPRYAVLDVLTSNGVEASPSSAMCLSEDKFVEVYVNKYRRILPELKKVYKCATRMETDLAGL